MKKLYCLILSIALAFTCSIFSGCEKDTLEKNISELRSNIYLGKVDSNDFDITLKCAYGFIEEPYALDGKTGEIVYKLKFKLVGDLSSNVIYSLAFNHEDFNYKKEFTFSPTTSTFTTSFEIEDFDKSDFSVNLFIGAKSYPVTLKSIVPTGVMSYRDALVKLQENEPSLIKDKTDENGNFNAEIFMRILVKNEYPYYYIGISHDGGIKAFLMDAKSGKILAVREVF